MRAVLLHGQRTITVENVPPPEPGPGESLVRTVAAGICGSDVHYYLHGHIGNKHITAPYIPGHEAAGIIEHAPDNDRGIAPGTAVGIEPAIPCGRCEYCLSGVPNLCLDMTFIGSFPGNGAMCELFTAPIENCFPLPAGMPAERGTLIETFAVGTHAVDLSGLKLAGTVAIFGAGSIGLSHLQLARCAGALDVTVVDMLEYRLELAERMGADLTVNSRSDDPVARILDHTGGRGVDIAFDCAGDIETPGMAIASLARNGRFVFTGIVPTSTVQWDTEMARKKGISIELVRRSRHAYERTLALAERGRIDLNGFITHRFPFERAVEAFETAAEYRDGVIKAVLTP